MELPSSLAVDDSEPLSMEMELPNSCFPWLWSFPALSLSSTRRSENGASLYFSISGSGSPNSSGKFLFKVPQFWLQNGNTIKTAQLNQQSNGSDGAKRRQIGEKTGRKRHVSCVPHAYARPMLMRATASPKAAQVRAWAGRSTRHFGWAEGAGVVSFAASWCCFRQWLNCCCLSFWAAKYS